MAYGTKYILEFTTLEGPQKEKKDYVIYLRKDGHSGSSINLPQLGGGGVVAKINKSRDSIYGLSEKNLSVDILSDLNLTELLDANPKEWQIELTEKYLVDEGTDYDERIEFSGYLQASKNSTPYQDGLVNYRLDAHDGLSLLKNIDFVNDSNVYYDGLTTIFDVIRLCLNKVGTNLAINTINNIIQDSGEIGYPDYADGLKWRFIDVDKYRGENEPLNAYKVLEDVLTSECSRLFQEQGEWWVEYVPEKSTGVVDTKKYNYAGVLQNYGFENLLISAVNESIYQPMGGGSISNLPAIKFSKVSHKLGGWKNYLINKDLAGWDGTNFTGWDIFGGAAISRVGDGSSGNPYGLKIGGVYTDKVVRGVGQGITLYAAGGDKSSLEKNIVFSGTAYTRDVEYVSVTCYCVITTFDYGQYIFGLNENGEWIRNGGNILMKNSDVNGRSKKTPVSWNVTSKNISDLKAFFINNGTPVDWKGNLSKFEIIINLVQGKDLLDPYIGETQDPAVWYKNMSLGWINADTNLNLRDINYKASQAGYAPNDETIEAGYGDYNDGGNLSALKYGNGTVTSGWLSPTNVGAKNFHSIHAADILRLLGTTQKVYDGTIWGKLKFRNILTMAGFTNKLYLTSYTYNYSSSFTDIRAVEFQNASITSNKKTGVLSDGTEINLVDDSAPSPSTGNNGPGPFFGLREDILQKWADGILGGALAFKNQDKDETVGLIWENPVDNDIHDFGSIIRRDDVLMIGKEDEDIKIGKSGGSIRLDSELSLRNLGGFDGKFLSDMLTTSRTISLPDEDIVINDWDYLLGKPEGIDTTFTNQLANKVFAGPLTGAAALPTFRSLVIADTTGLQTALDAKLSGGGTSGYLAKYTGGVTHANSVIFENGGNINIGGSMLPTARLSLQNNISSLGGDTVAINLREGATAGSLPAYGFGFSNASTSAFLDYRASTFNDYFSGHRFLVNNLQLFTMQGDGAFVLQGLSGSSVPRLKFTRTGATTERVLIDLSTGNNSGGLPAYGIGLGPNTEGYISYRSGQGSTTLFGHKFYVNNVEIARFRGDSTMVLAGSLGIGTSILTAYNLRVGKSITGAPTAYGISNSGIIQSDVTAGAFYSQTVASTQAASFTLPFIYHYSAQQGAFGAGSSVLTQIAYYAQASLTGATTNIGFRGAIPAGTNRWNTFMDGTAANHFAGNVYVGSTTGTYKLDVTGDVNSSTFYRIGGVRVGEWGQFQSHENFSSISSINWGANFLYGATEDMPGSSPQWHVMKLGIGSEYIGEATYLAFGRPFADYFDGKIYVRGIYGGVDSGWLSVGGNGVQDYSYDRGDALIQYRGTLIEEVSGDQGVFIGKDMVNGGVVFEMKVVDIDSSDVTTYLNWINPADGRLYYVEPASPYEKKKYLIEGEGGEGGGSYSGSFPISVSGSVISIATATGSQAGALSSTDWNVFNGKFNLPGGGSDGQVLTKSGGGAVWSSVGSGGVYSGTAPINISGTNISILTASASQTGALSASDWSTFNNKFSVPSGGIDGQVLMKSGSSVVWGSVSGGGGGSYTGVSPITVSGGNISIQQANTSQSGFLSNTDWNTFNNKLSDGFTLHQHSYVEGVDLIFKSSASLPNAGLSFVDAGGGILFSILNTSGPDITIGGAGSTDITINTHSGDIILKSNFGKVFIQNKEIDFSGFATGKILKATSSTKAEWVTP